MFLVNKRAKINMLNNCSESVLHLACENGLSDLVKLLLVEGSDPNVQTTSETDSQTPMHKAVLNDHDETLDLFIEHRESMQSK